MFEEYIYEDYVIDFCENLDVSEEAYYFIFNNKRQIYLTEDNSIPILTQDSMLNFNHDFKLYIGTYKNKKIFVSNLDEADNFYNILEIYDINPQAYQIAARAVLIRDWYINHQYCGKCGSKTEIDKKDMMLVCPKCKQMHYPRIAPAIIVAITKEDKLLMAKHSYHKQHRYALIAGFVEPAETIEEAVRREVKEEIGISIKNIKYVKSQSWPFPNSLMIGFTAQYESGQIKVDNDEILDAKWFTKEEIDLPESDISISSWLIQNFIDNH